MDVFKLGQKYKNNFIGFLDQMKTLKFAFEINWHLILSLIISTRLWQVHLNIFHSPSDSQWNVMHLKPSYTVWTVNSVLQKDLSLDSVDSPHCILYQSSSGLEGDKQSYVYQLFFTFHFKFTMKCDAPSYLESLPFLTLNLHNSKWNVNCQNIWS